MDMKTASFIAAVIALSSLVGCSNAGDISDPAPPVADVQVEACNHGFYFASGDVVWYGWHDYTTLPLTVEVKGVGDTAVPYAKDDAVLEQWIQDTGSAKRVTVQCGTTDGQNGVVDKFETITFSAAMPR